jgi:hypothetical protein
VERASGVSQKSSPGESHGDSSKDLWLIEFRKGRSELVEDEVRFSQLFDREHLKAHICQDDDISSVMMGERVVGKCFGDM